MRPLLIVLQLALTVVAILSLRLYALYHCNQRVLWSLITIAFALLAVTCVCVLVNQLTILTLISGHWLAKKTCLRLIFQVAILLLLIKRPYQILVFSRHTLTLFFRTIRVVTPWEALLLYDSILFGATMNKTYRYRRQQLPGGPLFSRLSGWRHLLWVWIKIKIASRRLS